MARKTQYDYYDDWFKATAVELGALPVFMQRTWLRCSIFIQ